MSRRRHRARRAGLGAHRVDPTHGTCKCVRNPRTHKATELCFVGRSKKHRSGWAFTGSCR